LYNPFSFFDTQRVVRRNAIPFCETATAACRCGVLGNEDRMAPERRLPAVIARMGRGQTPIDHLPGMKQDEVETFLRHITLVAGNPA